MQGRYRSIGSFGACGKLAVEQVSEYNQGMTAEPVEPVEEPSADSMPDDADTAMRSGLLSAASLAEARWQRLNEEDADDERRRAPVSARAHTWAMTLGGPKLAAMLADVDVASLSDDECVVFAQAVTRQQSWTDMMLFDVTAAFAAHRPGPDETERRFGFPPGPGVERRIQLGGEDTRPLGSFAASEWAAALKVSRAIATRLIADSLDLTARLHVVMFNARAGNGDTRRARMIADRTRWLDPATLTAVQSEITPILATVTAGKLEQIIDRIVGTRDPAAAKARAERASQRREVWIGHTRDEHADIYGTLDGIGATVLDHRLDELATAIGRVVRAHGEPAGFGPDDQSFDQRRARALVLLAAPVQVARLMRLARELRSPASDEPASDEPTDAETADRAEAAEADDPGQECAGLLDAITLYVHLGADGTLDLEDLGVLSMPTVRDLLATTTATVRVAPVIDLNATYTSPGYRPSVQLREQTVLMRATCWFPYCERPSRACDYEHSVPWPRGPTETGNAGPACRGHHRVKTHGNWRLHQACTGVYVWQAPTGHVYIVTPDGTHALS